MLNTLILTGKESGKKHINFMLFCSFYAITICSNNWRRSCKDLDLAGYMEAKYVKQQLHSSGNNYCATI